MTKTTPTISEPETDSRMKWITIGLLWFVFLFNYADRQAIFSVFPLIKNELQLTDVQLGVLGACFMWVYALCGPITGWITDLVSRKALILGSLIFWSVVTAATAIAVTNTIKERIVIFATALLINMTADVGKVTLAGKLRSKLTVRNIRLINKVSGLILLIFGTALLSGVLFFLKNRIHS